MRVCGASFAACPIAAEAEHNCLFTMTDMHGTTYEATGSGSDRSAAIAKLTRAVAVELLEQPDARGVATVSDIDLLASATTKAYAGYLDPSAGSGTPRPCPRPRSV